MRLWAFLFLTHTTSAFGKEFVSISRFECFRISGPLISEAQCTPAKRVQCIYGAVDFSSIGRSVYRSEHFGANSGRRRADGVSKQSGGSHTLLSATLPALITSHITRFALFERTRRWEQPMFQPLPQLRRYCFSYTAVLLTLWPSPSVPIVVKVRVLPSREITM
jgi:hypothetical protein